MTIENHNHKINDKNHIMMGGRDSVKIAKEYGIAILEIIKQENLSLDIVSEGELYTALKADFPPEKIHFHGNNKNRRELEFAIDANIGCIIIDNFDEIDLLETILAEKNKEIDVL